jgi:predicted DNA-binding protein (MmcQ/YjbR family)
MDVDLIRKICTSLPAVTEDVKWGNDLCFSVGGKLFCVCSLEPPFKVGFKVKDEEFEELSNRDGFIPAPYMARAKWVLLTKPGRLTRAELKHYITQSYELKKASLTKKLRKDLKIDD